MFSGFRKEIGKLRKQTSGNVAMMVALGMPALVGASGLAVDVTQWIVWKQELQFAVDQAAIAGAWARTDPATRQTYETRAAQEYNANLQTVNGFASNPAISLVDYDGGTANAVQVVASASRNLPFTGMFMDQPSVVRVSARAALEEGDSYSGCIVAVHPSAEGAFTLGGNASGAVTCGVAALSNHADAAMVKNGNSTAQLGQLVAAGGIDSDFLVNGTLHPNTAGLKDPFGNIAAPVPASSPARTYSCPTASAPTTVTTATVTTTTIVTYHYITANNSNQAVNRAVAGTNSYAYSSPTAGSTTNGTPQSGVTVANGTTAGTVAGAPAYTWVRQVMNSPKVHEIRKTVVNTTYSDVAVTTSDGSDGIARPEPGTYTSININCRTEFQPGIYVVDDIDFGQNHIVTGDDVLFVIMNADGMHINSQSNIRLGGISKDRLINDYGYSEEVASKIARMVIFDKNTTSQLKLNGTADVIFDGILYMPKREVWFNGTATASGYCMMVVSNMVTFTGTVDLNNFCLPAGAITPTVGGRETSVKLVA